MPRAFPLLGLALLAGCLAADEAPGPRAPSFLEPAILGGGAVEASIAVGLDGAVLACSYGDGVEDRLWASEDDGATWTRIAARAPPFDAAGDCDVEIARDGAWHYASMDPARVALGQGSLAVAASVSVLTSDDRGATWTAARILGAPDAYVDRPWLLAVPGALYLTHKISNSEPLQVWFAKSTDRGATWTPPVLVAVAQDPLAPNGNVGKMVATDDGRSVWIPIHRFNLVQGGGRSEWLEVARSRDAGATWQILPVAGPVVTRADYYLPSLARSTNGTLVMPIPLRNGSDAADLHVTISRDDGDTWSPPIPIAAGQEFRRAQAHVALDAAPEGGVLAAWQRWNGAALTLTLAHVDLAKEPRIAWTREWPHAHAEDALVEFADLERAPDGALHAVYVVPGDACRPESACVWVVRAVR